jgi:hypothetical protein
MPSTLLAREDQIPSPSGTDPATSVGYAIMTGKRCRTERGFRPHVTDQNPRAPWPQIGKGCFASIHVFIAQGSMGSENKNP